MLPLLLWVDIPAMPEAKGMYKVVDGNKNFCFWFYASQRRLVQENHSQLVLAIFYTQHFDKLWVSELTTTPWRKNFSLTFYVKSTHKNMRACIVLECAIHATEGRYDINYHTQPRMLSDMRVMRVTMLSFWMQDLPQQGDFMAGTVNLIRSLWLGRS